MIENNLADNSKETKSFGFFKSLSRSLSKWKLFLPKFFESSRKATDEQQDVIRLYAPQALTNDQFDEIVIRKYISLMTPKDFQETFNCELTEDNVDNLIAQETYPDDFAHTIEQSLMATFRAMQNQALDGKADVAWTIAEGLAGFSSEDLQYIHYKEGDSPDFKPYIRVRFSDISNIKLTLDFVETVENANEISSNSSSLSMKNAESIYNKLRTYELNLDAEQKSKIYYLSSELFRRAQIVTGIYQEPKPCAKEIHCLRMVLENTSDPSLVDCCLNRLSSDGNILKDCTPLLISAYKRVLSEQHAIYPEDAYRFNSQIATLYLQYANTKNLSFSGLDINSIAALRWSEHFYKKAYSQAPGNHLKYKALEAVANIQTQLGERQKSRLTALAAAKLLPAPEKYEKILDIALRDDKNAIPTIKRTIHQIKKEKMPFEIKKILYGKALLVTKQKTRDEKVISSVENLLPSKKLTPNNRTAQNISTHE